MAFYWGSYVKEDCMSILASISPDAFMLFDWLVVKGGLVALAIYELYKTDREIKRRQAEKAALQAGCEAEQDAAAVASDKVVKLPVEQPSKLKEAA